MYWERAIFVKIPTTSKNCPYLASCSLHQPFTPTLQNSCGDHKHSPFAVNVFSDILKKNGVPKDEGVTEDYYGWKESIVKWIYSGSKFHRDRSHQFLMEGIKGLSHYIFCSRIKHHQINLRHHGHRLRANPDSSLRPRLRSQENALGSVKTFENYSIQHRG